MIYSHRCPTTGASALHSTHHRKKINKTQKSDYYSSITNTVKNRFYSVLSRMVVSRSYESADHRYWIPSDPYKREHPSIVYMRPCIVTKSLRRNEKFIFVFFCQLGTIDCEDWLIEIPLSNYEVRADVMSDSIQSIFTISGTKPAKKFNFSFFISS